MQNKILSTFLTVFLITIRIVISQNTTLETDKKAEEKIYEIYDKALSYNSRVINGQMYGKTFPGKPLIQFLESTWLNGNIIYYDQLYNNVLLNYDIISDEVVMQIQNESGIYLSIRLNKSKISKFNIGDKYFMHFLSHPSSLKDGFYEILFDGKVKLIRDYSKKQKIADKREKYSVTYEDFQELFLVSDNQYKTVSSKKSLINSLQSHQKEIKVFIKNNKISWGKNRVNAAKTILNEYQKLLENEAIN